MKIYTTRGDSGETDIRGAKRVAKTDPRVEAYGTVDEANSVIGVCRPTGHEDVDDLLLRVQNQLHVVQAQLATPPGVETPVIDGADIDELENAIDHYDEELTPLTAFIIPGGSPSGSRLHQARAVVRRSERRAVELTAHDESVSPLVVAYLNRLSDLLFTLSRAVNARDGVEETTPDY